MRTLLLLRGVPGCGKSTWIKKNNLESYTVSSDELRLLFSNPVLDQTGNITISQIGYQIIQIKRIFLKKSANYVKYSMIL